MKKAGLFSLWVYDQAVPVKACHLLMFCLTKSENKKNKDICIAVTGGDKMADQKIDMTQDLKNCCHFIKIIVCVSVTENHHHKLLW